MIRFLWSGDGPVGWLAQQIRANEATDAVFEVDDVEIDEEAELDRSQSEVGQDL